MGLASALDLLEDGHRVTVLEAAPEPGGLAGSFDFGGVAAEKFYHFICGADRVYIRWLERLGLLSRLRWRRTRMGLFYDGGLHPFGDPSSLLRLPVMSLSSRLRYGYHVWSAIRLKNWKPLENVRAKPWLIEGEGEEPYRVIWEPLLRDKFGDETENLSAAWIWSRIQRLASSRSRFFQEWLGFVQGGTRVFIDALKESVRAKGGRIHCEVPVEEILMDGDLVGAVRAAGNEYPADAFVSTAPLPILAQVGRGLPEDYLRAALDLDNIGVRCILLKLEKPLSPYFWINTNAADNPLCGLIEYTNLHPPEDFGGYSFVYSPLYVSSTTAEYRRPDEEVLNETLDGISAVRPEFDRSSVVDYRVFRAPFAQPVCPVGFTKRLAPIQTPVANLVAADTTHLLPYDRSISDSLGLAERMIAALRGTQ
jgi:protoporphyrinogen oxidase